MTRNSNTQRSRNLGHFLCLLWVSQSILYWPGAFFSLLESWLAPLPEALGGGILEQLECLNEFTSVLFIVSLLGKLNISSN